MPEIYNYDFENNPKPWLEGNRQDMDKYFNYGFNEETWKHHSRDVLARSHPQVLEQLALMPEL